METEAADLPTPKAGSRRFIGPPLKAAGKAFSTFKWDDSAIEMEEWVGLTVVDATETTGKYGDQIVWLLEVDGEEKLGRVAYFTSFSKYDGSGQQPVASKFFLFYKAFGLELPEDGDRVDPDVIIGRKLRGMFEHAADKKFPTLARVKAAKKEE